MLAQMPEPMVPPTFPPIIDPPPGDDLPPLPEHDPEEPEEPTPLRMLARPASTAARVPGAKRAIARP